MVFPPLATTIPRPETPDDTFSPTQKTAPVVFTAKGLPLKQVPYLIRNLETQKTHRLREALFIGRSQTKMREGIDLIIDNCEISRIHASIQVNEYGIFIFREGHGIVHVDGFPLEEGASKQLMVGTFIRFGETSMWVVERASLFKPHKSSVEKDPLDLGQWVETRIHSKGDSDTLKRSQDWFGFIEALLDITLDCPPSAKVSPCVDAVVIEDNGEQIAEYGPLSFEEMVAFDISDIKDVFRGEGQVFRSHLSTDPLKLSLVTKKLWKVKKKESRQAAAAVPGL